MASQAVETAMEAEVVESLPNDLFRLELLDGKSDGKSSVTAHISPRSEKDFLRLLPGDRVRVQLSPRDPRRGRIVKRCES